MNFHLTRGLTTVLLLAIGVTAGVVSTHAQDAAKKKSAYRLEESIPYYGKEAPDEYAKERCSLDVYVPTGRKDFPTVVFFHGGGLKGGSRFIPKGLRDAGIGVVTVDYRLNPKAKCPAYLEDAAAAVAWTFNNIEKFGGDPNRIFVSGHSAGGYLASMVGLDKRWLAAHDIDADDLAGLIPLSGHTITHFTVRDERGISRNQPIIDEFAPLFHVRKEAPPLLLITGDRDLEIPTRYEENAYLESLMKTVGHPNTTLYELDGFTHGSMVDPSCPLTLKFISEIIKDQSSGAR
ncbi:Carboxylesterase NlhH [Planctomycetes bacterium Pan216]|uniref:Carboxylesterase NlhH n=2 Tax=Kolteria novifilia TaxID=2527975 RepID=A0A518B4Z5_9BACT|nr:Carboxylesterase NlhH [Planctomycetes bacterium Pan216]